MNKANNIWERFAQFADRIEDLGDILSETTAGDYTAEQPLHGEMTPALKRIEARIAAIPAGEERMLRIAIIGLKESEFVLHMILAGQFLSLTIVAPLLVECYQLQHIMNAGIRRASKPANGKPTAARPPAAQLPSCPTTHQKN